MYKVFVNKSPILLTENRENLSKKKWEFHPYKSKQQIKDLVWELENNKEQRNIALIHFDMDELWCDFVSQFRYVQAAGGMVFNRKEQFLVIHRNGKWDLPKGHLKKGERPEFGGMREVEEECGISGLTIDKPLDNTFHMYERNGMVLKKTFWYLMKSDFEGPLTPQIEEGITEVTWKDASDIEELNKTYPIIRKLLVKGLDLVNR